MRTLERMSPIWWLLGILLVVGGSIASAAYVDVVQSPTLYFTPDDALKASSPYYRYSDGDWGWTHNPIAGTPSSASLNISAYDVDYLGDGWYSGERDYIYALDSGTWVSLGYLTGLDNTWSYTSFVLGPQFYDDIGAGLQVKMDIDTANEGWAVSIAKSALEVDGGQLPNPDPSIPDPASTAILLGASAAALARLKRILAA